MRAHYIKYTLLLLLSVFIASCGGDDLGNDNVTVPEDGTLTVLLATSSVSDPNANANYLPNMDFVVVAKDSEDRPVRNAEITINYPFAAPFAMDAANGPGGPCVWDAAMSKYGLAGNLSASQVVMQFYDDDGDPTNVPFTVKTDEYGVARVWYDLVTGCVGNVAAYACIGHFGVISAQSGETADDAEFEVTCQ